jgi:amino acid transporter
MLTPEPVQTMERGVTLKGAISANILNMVGVGPFITIPLALAAMGGPQAMLGWVLGGLISLCDGFVWAELGSAMPHSGGPYHYLREAFGPLGFGNLLSFLFVWQTMLIGPLTIASGAVGFAQYSKYLMPSLHGWQLPLLAGLICLLNMVMLLRRISSINWLSIVIATVVIATTAWIVVSGLLHFHPAMAFDFPPGAFHLSRGFFAGLGASTLIAVYDYSGYNTVCMIGEEVHEPRKTIPRSIGISIVLIGILYLAMNVSILGVVPWREAMHSDAIVALFTERIYGVLGAKISTALILIASFGSVFALLLSFSRVPYGAAVDGHFFAIFAKLHPKGHYPVIAVLTLGVISALACIFSLGDLINLMVVVQIMLQFMAQCVAVIVLRKKALGGKTAFRMPLFPLPALIALTGWAYIVVTSGVRYIAIGFALMFVGVLAFLLRSYKVRQWPFKPA